MKTKTNNLRRRVRWNRVCLLLLIFAFLMSFAVSALADSTTDAAPDCTIVTVSSGDTMWGLIKAANPDFSGNMNKAVYATCQLNDMQAAKLYAGQKLLIPNL